MIEIFAIAEIAKTAARQSGCIGLGCAALVAFCMHAAAAGEAKGPGEVIAVCVLRSEGEFASRDKLHGVEQSPRTSSIVLVDVNTREARPLPLGLKRAEHPQFSADGPGSALASPVARRGEAFAQFPLTLPSPLRLRSGRAGEEGFANETA